MEAARVPVVGRWEPHQRRRASMGSTVAAIILLLVAVAVVFGNVPNSGTLLLVILIALIAMFVFQALVVVTGLRQQPLAESEGGAWQESYAAPLPPPSAAPAAVQTLTLKCSSCGTVFDVEDTGARPLRHVCPGCGSEGQLTEEDIGPSAAAPPRPAAESITLKCGNCATIFDVTDTGERPLHHVCPGCGSEGVLREEDLGPAPVAPAPIALRPPPAPAARARPTQTVKTLKLRCKNCSTVFTLRDTGERPLYHECPGCKATGVLR